MKGWNEKETDMRMPFQLIIINLAYFRVAMIVAFKQQCECWFKDASIRKPKTRYRFELHLVTTTTLNCITRETF